jgi:endonuclease/exonuclease/phosphatase family metal-dependent hydrolase
MFHDGHSFGNAVLSRWPAEPLADEPLPRVDGSPGHRRVVAATIDSPWGHWPFASTHLDHRFDASSTRVRQVEALLTHASEWRGDPAADLPVVIGADLNSVPDSDEIRMLTGRRAGVDGIVMSDVWEQAGVGPGATWRRGNPYLDESAWPDRRLDYLLVSWPRPKPIGNPLHCWLAGDGPVHVGGESVWPSDHAAVVAELATPEQH